MSCIKLIFLRNSLTQNAQSIQPNRFVLLIKMNPSYHDKVQMCRTCGKCNFPAANYRMGAFSCTTIHQSNTIKLILNCSIHLRVFIFFYVLVLHYEEPESTTVPLHYDKEQYIPLLWHAKATPPIHINVLCSCSL